MLPEMVAMVSEMVALVCGKEVFVRSPMFWTHPRTPKKATTKGFAIGSAALASFLLFGVYMDEIASFAHTLFTQVGKSLT
ncbi:hypothetical protein L1987_54137 [Smallanthus sonchifolius]|uniref:Uncharacterized protein n=1 Tax=Smallanthus sonchifolius TaxID=185202 RepID=A0ACB9E6R6_9ASTR|nr:hypothetical protein L1987_54137 [Smallanthus sonchifolius]